MYLIITKDKIYKTDCIDQLTSDLVNKGEVKLVDVDLLLQCEYGTWVNVETYENPADKLARLEEENARLVEIVEEAFFDSVDFPGTFTKWKEKKGYEF